MRISAGRVVIAFAGAIFIATLIVIGVSRCVARQDESSIVNEERAKRCTSVPGHFIRKEGQAAGRVGSGSTRFTYWCTDEEGRLYDLWFDSGRDYRRGPTFE